MAAGTLHGANYYMGDDLLPSTTLNPKGYFESKKIEQINEEILAKVVPSRPRGQIGKLFFRERPTRNLRWLARVPVKTVIPPCEELKTRIEQAIAQEPFCYKDPRFCYTLPTWRPYLKNTVYLCVFRHPASTASSIIKLYEKGKLEELKINLNQAFEVWRLMYLHILQIHQHQGDWLFMHYEQFFDQESLSKVEDFIEAKIDRQFPDLALKREKNYPKVAPQIAEVYQELCRLANFPIN
ncbi:MAG TPA: hypothetical protein V6D02_11640 [Candidatus Obscuribacterales bacterium]